MEEDGLVMSISLGGEIEDALESALKPMRSAPVCALISKRL